MIGAPRFQVISLITVNGQRCLQRGTEEQREGQKVLSCGIGQSGGEAGGRYGHCWLGWVVLTVKQPLPGQLEPLTLSR